MVSKKSSKSFAERPLKEPATGSEELIPQNVTDCVLDAGVILRYFSKTPSYVQEWLDSHLFNDQQHIQVHCHAISRTEVFYIACRDAGLEVAKELLEKMDRVFMTHNELTLAYTAGLVKCAHPVALGDCFSIATAKLLGCSVYFREEKELTKETVNSIKEKFGVQVIVIRKTP